MCASAGPRRLAEMAVLALAAALMAYVTFWTAQDMWFSWEIEEVAQGTVPIPLWIPKIEVPAGAGLLLVAILDELVIVLGGAKPSYVVAAEERAAAGDLLLLGVAGQVAQHAPACARVARIARGDDGCGGCRRPPIPAPPERREQCCRQELAQHSKRQRRAGQRGPAPDGGQQCQAGQPGRRRDEPGHEQREPQPDPRVPLSDRTGGGGQRPRQSHVPYDAEPSPGRPYEELPSCWP